MVERLAGLLIGALSLFCRLLPRRALLAVGRAAGLGIFHMAPSRRRTALRNMELALGGGMTPDEVRETVRRSFAHLGMNLAEFLAFPSLDGPRTLDLVRFEGEQNLRDALSLGRGALILSAHLGNWDLLSAALSRKGYDLAVVSKVSRSEAVNRVWMGYRASAGIRVLHGKGMMRDILRHLRSGGVVGFVLDQNALREDGVFVPFFGRPACTLSSLAVIARRTGAPVVPALTFREGAGHRAVVEPAMDEPRVEDHDSDVLERTRRYTLWTEDAIRRHPDQWTWLHDRWRTRPQGEGKDQSSKSKVQSQEGQGAVVLPLSSRADAGRSDLDSGLPHTGAVRNDMDNKPASSAAVFLDRDGTILHEEGYLGQPEDMRFFPGVAQAMRALQDSGYRLIVVTNQSGVGRGYFEEEDALAVNLAMVQELGRQGVHVEEVLYCPHHPDDGCACRKPGAMMIERAASDLGFDLARSWIVGDTFRDAKAGLAAGIRAVVLRTGKPDKGEISESVPILADLPEAARHIAGEGRP